MQGVERFGGRAFVIAEVGGNPEGDFELAKKMVREAAKTGVDAVKFQTYRAEKLVRKSEKWATKRFTKLAFTKEQFIELAGIARGLGIHFMSTPFDLEAVDFLDGYMPVFKIASGDITFLQMIQKIAAKNKPIILSTGASNIDEIRRAVDVIRKTNPGLLDENRVAVLHCVCSYPTPPQEANMLSIPFLKEKLGVPVGYSDHTEGTTACLTAAALGACIIEKHFDLEGNEDAFEGGIYGKGDHILSARPGDMKRLVDDIRKIEKTRAGPGAKLDIKELIELAKSVAGPDSLEFLGEYGKDIMPCESKNGIRIKMRRCVTARTRIGKGEILREDMLTALRPAEGGVLAEGFFNVVGKSVGRDIMEGETFSEKDLV
jgi:sialic acid synthase SpsE